MNYTKGEWKAWDKYIVCDGVTLAKVESLANANLIAAAPDMYEALKTYGSALMFLEGNFKERFSYTELESLNQAYRKGFEALAKAEGKTTT